MTDLFMGRLAALTASLALSGCAVVAPYDSNFSCPGNTEYGKCTSMQGAYSEALGGDVVPEPREGERDKKSSKRGTSPSAPPALSRYKEAEYAELAKLIEEPVTPIVKPPEVLRTLIIGYGTNDKTFYAPRHIFYFASEAGFVLGDAPSLPARDGSQTVFPNGEE